MLWMLLAACAARGPLAVGTWGGAGFSLEVGDDGARLSGPCAHADLPALVAAEGVLRAAFTWEMDQGDINEFDSDRSFPAHVEAEVKGRRLRGTLVVDSWPEKIEPLDLRRGRAPAVGACPSAGSPS